VQIVQWRSNSYRGRLIMLEEYFGSSSARRAAGYIDRILKGEKPAEVLARVVAFRQGLRPSTSWAGWSSAPSKEAPDVILASSGAVVGPLRHATRTVPVVFTETSDPVGAGFIESLARSGGNITGFLSFEYGLSGKWLELLKQIAPEVTRVAILRDPTIPSGTGQWGAIQAVAPSFGVELRPIGVNDANEIERDMAAFARGSNGGMIVTASSLTLLHRDLIIALAARHKLPAVYFQHTFIPGGGLASYGTDTFDVHRRAASYVDRILKGEKPADLPVQAPTKYELVFNLKTAKALGLEVPPTLLARADGVIE
jgi:putative tryptophan/tyrosine transport system substrate-binding protein